jgi:hypothetical protein
MSYTPDKPSKISARYYLHPADRQKAGGRGLPPQANPADARLGAGRWINLSVYDTGVKCREGHPPAWGLRNVVPPGREPDNPPAIAVGDQLVTDPPVHGVPESQSSVFIRHSSLPKFQVRLRTRLRVTGYRNP